MIENITTTPEAEVIRLKSLLDSVFLDLKQAEITRIKLVNKIKELKGKLNDRKTNY